MTTGEFWDLMWSFPWYKRIWFAIVDDAVVFLTIWWVWVLIILFAFWPEITDGFIKGYREGKKWIKDVTDRNL